MIYTGKTISLKAAEPITAYRLLTTDTDNELKTATGATKYIIGVSIEVDTKAEDACDTEISGIVPVEYGGSIAVGDPLTADVQGRAIKATQSGYIAGFATLSGTSGDIGSVHLRQGKFAVETAAP